MIRRPTKRVCPICGWRVSNRWALLVIKGLEVLCVSLAIVGTAFLYLDRIDTVELPIQYDALYVLLLAYVIGLGTLQAAVSFPHCRRGDGGRMPSGAFHTNSAGEGELPVASARVQIVSFGPFKRKLFYPCPYCGKAAVRTWAFVAMIALILLSLALDGERVGQRGFGLSLLLWAIPYLLLWPFTYHCRGRR